MLYMDTLCGVINGLLVAVAGVALLLFGLGTLNAMMANIVAGVTLGLFGISFIVHSVNACPICKGMPERKK